MKHSLILAGLLALAAGAQAADVPSFKQKPGGQPLVINGKTYYKQAAPAGKLPLGVSARSAASEGGATLKRGDVLRSEGELAPSKVSGVVMVKLASPRDEAALAHDHSLSVRYRTQSVVVFDAPAQAELLSLQQRLAADKRVKQVQLEVFSNSELPQ